jgi:hypothetical protein
MKKINTKENICTLPKEYLRQQRIIKMLRLPRHELVMWYCYTPEGKEKDVLFGVYLKDDDFCVYSYDPETLESRGLAFNGYDQQGKEIYSYGIEDFYRFLHRQCGITDLLSYAIGISNKKPPKPEGKILLFPTCQTAPRETLEKLDEQQKNNGFIA